MEVRDSIVLQHYPVFGNNNFLFFIDQDSIRFAPFKILAVYYYPEGKAQRKYLGNYQIVQKSAFELDKMSAMMSLLIFGENHDSGRKTLSQFKFRGQISKSTMCCMICAFRESYEEKYEVRDIPRATDIPALPKKKKPIVPPF